MCGFIAYTLLIVVLGACVDETFNTDGKEGFILVDGFFRRSYEGPEIGDPKVTTLLVLGFDKTTNECKPNFLYYGSDLTDIIHHPVKQAEYNFFFIANEPSVFNSKAELDAITICTNFFDFPRMILFLIYHIKLEIT